MIQSNLINRQKSIVRFYSCFFVGVDDDNDVDDVDDKATNEAFFRHFRAVGVAQSLIAAFLKEA